MRKLNVDAPGSLDARPRDRDEVTLHLQTLTPILGGAVEPRTVDDVDVVRVPGIRGQLRFWWRALFGAGYQTSKDLYEAERALWGGIGDKRGEGGRSKVVLVVRVLDDDPKKSPGCDEENPRQAGADAYALWPARGNPQENLPTAPRRTPGLRFDLTASYPAEAALPVLATLKAWILFGGIGGRTRRGCGAVGFRKKPVRPGAAPQSGLDVPAEGWLPRDAQPESIQSTLSLNADEPGAWNRPFCCLTGARFCAGKPVDGATSAWNTAVGWLRDFRQGTDDVVDTAAVGDFARERPCVAGSTADENRPGRSRWREADKIRHLALRFGQPAVCHPHSPRGNAAPVWPRSQFGLPIQHRWQTTDRHRVRNAYTEPRACELAWRDPGGATHSRLASPLIVKPLQLADGRCVALALWLRRTLPPNSVVGIKARPVVGAPLALVATSEAPADLMDVPGDIAPYKPLVGKPDMKTAFLDWVDRELAGKGTRGTL